MPHFHRPHLTRNYGGRPSHISLLIFPRSIPFLSLFHLSYHPQLLFRHRQATTRHWLCKWDSLGAARIWLAVFAVRLARLRQYPGCSAGLCRQQHRLCSRACVRSCLTCRGDESTAKSLTCCKHSRCERRTEADITEVQMTPMRSTTQHIAARQTQYSHLEAHTHASGCRYTVP